MGFLHIFGKLHIFRFGVSYLSFLSSIGFDCSYSAKISCTVVSGLTLVLCVIEDKICSFENM